MCKLSKPREHKKQPVTLIVGIKCLDGIVVACESRTTLDTGRLRDDAQKLHTVTFADGNTAIVAEAGNAFFSSIAVERLLVYAKDRALDDYRAVADCVEKSVGRLHQSMKEPDPKWWSEEGFQKHCLNYDFELMIAHYHRGQPYIFKLQFVSGRTQKEDRLYSTLGCGTELADFLISRLDLSDFSAGHAFWLSVYAVEEVKKHDGRCGGKTRCALITDENGRSSSQIFDANEPAIQDLVEDTLAFSGKADADWKETIGRRLKSIVAKNPMEWIKKT